MQRKIEEFWNEPDIFFEKKPNGYILFAVRSWNKAWCGYVGIPKCHKLYGKSLEGFELECHGGLTFAGQHKNFEFLNDSWLFGFDCSHIFDLIPHNVLMANNPMAFYWDEMQATYKNLEYVKENIYSLYEQLKLLEN